ncbi:polysaccharide lyase family 8 [Cordyceps militaris]|uniref:Polysaccharide lyase family 8 n=1 Tax=Cordyceps militaris TaxID=73501 RepID=A0A2H4SMN2_CORMI|nr:polysaccharide lyase family 8 [Cordyceps militaris]
MRLYAAACALCTLARAVAADAQDTRDMATLSRRRVADLAEFPNPLWFGSVQEWIDTQKSDGTWADVNYLSGCPARRANWPIQEHWNRIITLAAAWSGASSIADRKWTNSTTAWDAISNGLDHWFENDYKPAACLGNGGNASVFLSVVDLGRVHWAAHVERQGYGTPQVSHHVSIIRGKILTSLGWIRTAILIPQLSSTACLLARDGPLSQDQRDGCIRLTKRTYDNIDLSYGTGGNLTAANVVLVLQSAVSLGLFTHNVTIVESAMKRAFSGMTVRMNPLDPGHDSDSRAQFSNLAMQDGIHKDGSFLQHDGILYNGNYGKDLLNVFIQLEGEAVGTRFAADAATKQAMSTLIKGNEWMIFTDKNTRQQHWDFNAIGRFVSYPTKDLQASADINFNVTKLARAVTDFDGADDVNDTIKRLESNGTEPLVGNKGFWASDYMIHRRESFIIGNKMLSSRSTTSELVNGANPLGYHLGQGTLFTYVDGTEYKDIWASWDWNLIPGTTVVRETPALAAAGPNHRGARDFVGVVSDGRVGAAVEDYADPSDGHVSYKKAWFYLDDAVLVSVADVQTRGVGGAPVITVLENRAKADGGAFVDGERVPLGTDTKVTGSTLLYGGNGYLAYGAPFDLTLSEGDRTGNWSAISTSAAGPATVAVFSAYAAVTAPRASYALFPATSPRKLAQEAQAPTWVPVWGDGVSGAAGQGVLSVVFWPGGGGTVTVGLAEIGWADRGTVRVTAGQPGLFLITGSREAGSSGGGRLALAVSAADPTQKRKTATLELLLTRPLGEAQACGRAVQSKVDLDFVLPTGGMAGSSVEQEAFLHMT